MLSKRHVLQRNLNHMAPVTMASMAMMVAHVVVVVVVAAAARQVALQLANSCLGLLVMSLVQQRVMVVGTTAAATPQWAAAAAALARGCVLDVEFQKTAPLPECGGLILLTVRRPVEGQTKAAAGWRVVYGCVGMHACFSQTLMDVN
jgi:hypothetical protein